LNFLNSKKLRQDFAEAFYIVLQILICGAGGACRQMATAGFVRTHLMSLIGVICKSYFTSNFDLSWSLGYKSMFN